MDVGLNAMVLSRDHIGQFRHLVESGMVSFKFFMPYRVGTRAVKGLPQIGDDRGCAAAYARFVAELA